MDITLREERLRQWTEAEAAVRRRLSSERGIAEVDLDVQAAVQALRGLDPADPAALLDEEWTPDKLHEQVASVDFAAWADYETVELTESVLPRNVPRRLEEEKVKFRSEIWHIHRYDPDPFPSLPHAHNHSEGLKLDLRNGRLYRRRQEVGHLPRKSLIEFRQRIRRIQLPPLEA